MDEIDFTNDDFSDIVAKDNRYSARAYALLMDTVTYLTEDGKHVSGEDILQDFKSSALYQFGPMAYTVLTEWGVKSCEDIGEMMFNLADTHRVGRDDTDNAECFAGGYDFKEAFFDPFEP